MSANNLGFDDDFMATMLGDFLDESQGYLTRLNENLLTLDELVGSLENPEELDVDPDLLNEMFRDAHSLKGLSAMLQLGDINGLTHRIENLFDAARQNNLTITRDVTDVMFQAFDRLTAMVDKLKNSSSEEIEYESILEAMAALQEAQTGSGNEVVQAAGTETPNPDVETPDLAVETPDSAGKISDSAAETPDSAEVISDSAAETAGDIEEQDAGAAAVPDLEHARNENGAADTPAEKTPELSAEELSAEESPGSPAGHSETSSEIASVIDDTPDPFAEVVDETEISDKYLAIFIDESEESLDELSEILIGDDSPDIGSLLGICHRIKGGAAAIGLNRVAKLSHCMEDLLQELREGGRNASPSVCDAFLAAVDSLRSFVGSLKAGERSNDNFADAYQQLRAARSHTDDSEGGTETVEPPHVPESGSRIDRDDAPDGAEEPDVLKTQQQQSLPEQPRAVPVESVSAATDQSTNGNLESAAALAPMGAASVCGQITLERGLPLAEIKARLLYDRLSHLGSLFYTEPSEQALESLEGTTRLTFGVSGIGDKDLVRQHLQLEGVESIELVAVAGSAGSAPAPSESAEDSPGVAAPPDEQTVPAGGSGNAANQPPPPAGPPPAPRAAARTSAATPPSKDRPAETVRVDIERLDQLMNLAGQLVISKARFGQLSDQLKDLSSRKQSPQCLGNVASLLNKILAEAEEGVKRPADAKHSHSLISHVHQIQNDLEIVRSDIAKLFETRAVVNKLSEAVHQLDRITDGIQKSVMDTRMVPIGPLFNRFKRVVRDVTRGNGKDVQLVIRGEKTELDKRMIDELSDPLIHMVRNSADHGIELPDERETKGKSRRGTVTLDAFHRGNRIVIQVKDDGRGLDPQMLRAKAVEKGIISQQDADRLSAQQSYQLIWEPGFSTAERITEVSGRGMGMDIVRSRIEQLSGSVELDSQLGVGTTITIKLPLTMAILPSLLTVISGDVFAIPVESVVEIVRVREDQFATVHGMRTAQVRQRVVSVVELADLFRWNRSGCSADAQGDRTLVIIGSDGHELGLAVDALLGEEDIVVKSLAENYRNVDGLAGASILGDGRVSLILDVGALLDLSFKACSTYRSDESTPTPRSHICSSTENAAEATDNPEHASC